jgi:hypothetical protein
MTRPGQATQVQASGFTRPAPVAGVASDSRNRVCAIGTITAWKADNLLAKQIQSVRHWPLAGTGRHNGIDATSAVHTLRNHPGCHASVLQRIAPTKMVCAMCRRDPLLIARSEFNSSMGETADAVATPTIDRS